MSDKPPETFWINIKKTVEPPKEKEVLAVPFESPVQPKQAPSRFAPPPTDKNAPFANQQMSQETTLFRHIDTDRRLWMLAATMLGIALVAIILSTLSVLIILYK